MQAVAFAIFIWFCARFIWPPLMRAIDTRQKQIADGLAAGEQGRQSLATAEKRVADLLAEAKSRSSEIIAQGEKLKAEAIACGARRGEGRGRSHPRAGEGRDRAGSARARRKALRDQVAALAVAGASKILRREIDAQAHTPTCSRSFSRQL